MSSDFKIAQCIEWCTDLPTYNHPRESPVFMLNGNEWIFRFVLQFETEWCYEDEMEIYLSYENRIKTYWSYELYLEHKNERMDCELCSVDFKVGYEGEGTFSLGKGVFNVSEHRCIWSCCWLNCLKKIKFRFNFHNAVKPPLKNSNETETNTGSNSAEETQISFDLRTNFHLTALSRDFSKMLDESLDYDVEVKCEDETFPAHRYVLGTRSPVFSAMLKSNMVEGETGLIKVEGINASIFRSFLHYLYSGTLPELSTDIAKQLYEVGDRYAVEELKKACSEYLTKNLSEDNVCEILVMADQHSDEDFRKSVIAYIVDKKIPEQDKFSRDFCKSNPLLANEIMILYIQKNRSK